MDWQCTLKRMPTDSARRQLDESGYLSLPGIMDAALLDRARRRLDGNAQVVGPKSRAKQPESRLLPGLVS
jgi:hypothetical protein